MHESPSPTLTVVASIFPVADLARQIAGDEARVITLIPPGASPHTFEPTPSQMRELFEADLVISVGAGLDDWLLGSISGDLRGQLLVITDGLDLLYSYHDVDCGHGHDGHDCVGEDDHSHSHDGHSHSSGGDPHVWLDPLLVRDEILPKIAEALSGVNPEGSQGYSERLSDYQETLTTLDSQVRERLAGLQGERFISFHPAWGYFGRRYGLEEIGHVAPFPGKEPSARYLADLIEVSKRQGARVVAIEPQFSPKIAETISQEINGVLILLDPLGGDGVEGRSSYRDLIWFNTVQLAEAWR